MGRTKDITGTKSFYGDGKLTALEVTDKREAGSAVWKCKCECGNIIEMSARKFGQSRSCGCDSWGCYVPVNIKLEPLNTDYLTDEVVKQISLQIVIQATYDWTALCEGERKKRQGLKVPMSQQETRSCNFDEIEQFFKTDAKTYLSCTSYSAGAMLEELKRQRNNINE